MGPSAELGPRAPRPRASRTWAARGAPTAAGELGDHRVVHSADGPAQRVDVAAHAVDVAAHAVFLHGSAQGGDRLAQVTKWRENHRADAERAFRLAAFAARFTGSAYARATLAASLAFRQSSHHCRRPSTAPPQSTHRRNRRTAAAATPSRATLAASLAFRQSSHHCRRPSTAPPQSTHRRAASFAAAATPSRATLAERARSRTTSIGSTPAARLAASLRRPLSSRRQ